MKIAEIKAMQDASREVLSITDEIVEYNNLEVPVKLITLVGGLVGLVHLEHYEAFVDALTQRDEDAEAELPLTWKLGGTTKCEIPTWYNSESFTKTKGKLK